MIQAAVLLLFLWCGPSEGICEEGLLMAPSCQSGVAWLMQGLRPDQELYVLECKPLEGAWR
jgi:hypothetical protein